MEWAVRVLAITVSDTSVTRTLKRALRVVGDLRALATHLGVSEAELADWLAGRGTPTNAAYLRALDLVASGPFALRRK